MMSMSPIAEKLITKTDQITQTAHFISRPKPWLFFIVIDSDMDNSILL